MGLIEELTDHKSYMAQTAQFRILSSPPYPSRHLLPACKSLCHLLRNRTQRGSLSLFHTWVFCSHTHNGTLFSSFSSTSNFDTLT